MRCVLPWSLFLSISYLTFFVFSAVSTRSLLPTSSPFLAVTLCVHCISQLQWQLCIDIVAQSSHNYKLQPCTGINQSANNNNNGTVKFVCKYALHNIHLMRMIYVCNCDCFIFRVHFTPCNFHCCNQCMARQVTSPHSPCCFFVRVCVDCMFVVAFQIGFVLLLRWLSYFL